MTRKLTDREAKAIAYTLADEIQTRAQTLVAGGMQRDRAIMLVTAQASGMLHIVRG